MNTPFKIALADYDPYVNWVFDLSEASDVGAKFYFKCFNCTGFVNVPGRNTKAKGMNFVVAQMPLFFEGNNTLFNSTETYEAMKVYRQSKDSCVTIVEEIFDKYCVSGVTCNSYINGHVSENGILMVNDSYMNSNSHQVDKIAEKYILIWGKKDFCDKDGATTPDLSIETQN